jgi:lipopolysaccharide transport system permease protein
VAIPAPAIGSGRSVMIEPGRLKLLTSVRELWEYRELLYFLIWRDIKVRYKQTLFGAGWAVGQPLLMMVVFAIFLGRLVHVPSDGIPYPIFAFTALIPWTLFSQALSGASNSVVSSSNLISKIYFPRLLLPTAVAASFLVDFGLALVVLAAMMVFYGIVPGIAILWLPAFAALAFLAALAVGILFAAVNVRYRDVRYAVPFIVQLWLFASPVAYSTSLIPSRFRFLYELNPMVGVIDGFRWALLGSSAPPIGALALSVIGTVVILTGSLLYFRNVERGFADVI